MTSQQIEQFLEFPHLINEYDLPILKDSIKAYPYVGLFHMLYLKGLHNTKSIYFDKALSKAALVINDRIKLHQILNDDDPTDDLKQQDETLTNLDEIKKDPIENDNLVVEADLKVENLILDNELQLLQDNIVTEAIDHSIQADIASIINEEVLPPLMTEELEEEIVTSALTDASPKSFGDWLNAMLPAEEEVKVSKQKPLKSSKDLIDQFIATANKRIKVSKNTPESIDIASKSIEDKNDFATETLAQVYASQKKYVKSIEIYELLALKFPEKKTFFASRIRFLREKIEYDN